MKPADLTCKEFITLVTEYLEDALPLDEWSRFEAHLAVCPGCSIYFEQIKQTIRWTGQLTEDQISDQAKVDILKAFRNWKSGS